MGTYAVVIENIVKNVIVLNDNQINEFEKILNAKLIDALPLGLCIGDMKVGDNWTRNLNGIQTILEPITPQQQTDYGNLVSDLSIKTYLVEQVESSLNNGVESILGKEQSKQETNIQRALQTLQNAENSLREGVESVG